MNLRDFANHNMLGILNNLRNELMEEPWGKNNRILSTYINVNFEIAYEEKKVYENEKDNIAFWKVGNLVSVAGDPLWFVYGLNENGAQKWDFEKCHYGSFPPVYLDNMSIDEFQVEYRFPQFHSSWQLRLEPPTIKHIMGRNRDRLISVFGNELSQNDHMLLRTILGELELQKKRSDIMNQWYFGKYQFLMPLYLKKPNEVSLTATLEPLDEIKCYKVRTLLYPEYAYPHIRAVIKNRSTITGWMDISDTELDSLDFI